MQREADIFSFARCGSPCGYINLTENNVVIGYDILNGDGSSDLKNKVIYLYKIWGATYSGLYIRELLWTKKPFL